MSKKIIHVNRQFIGSNLKGHNRPVFTIKEGGKTKYARQVKVLGESDILVTDEMTFAEAKAL